MKYLVIAITYIVFSSTAVAQERGLLASILYDSCKPYKEGVENYEYESFCSGYFEAIIEQKQLVEKKGIFACFPTYGDFDPFKKSVIQTFMAKFDLHQARNNDFVRAYGLANESVDELFAAMCEQ